VTEQIREWLKRNREYLTSPDFAALHQLPSISPLWSYDESYYRTEIVDDLLHITRLAGRRLTPDEMALYLQQTSKSTVAKSYDRPTAIAATLLLINRGWLHVPVLPADLPTFQPPSLPESVPTAPKGSHRGGIVARAPVRLIWGARSPHISLPRAEISQSLHLCRSDGSRDGAKSGQTSR